MTCPWLIVEHRRMRASPSGPEPSLPSLRSGRKKSLIEFAERSRLLFHVVVYGKAMEAGSTFKPQLVAAHECSREFGRNAKHKAR